MNLGRPVLERDMATMVSGAGMARNGVQVLETLGDGDQVEATLPHTRTEGHQVGTHRTSRAVGYEDGL
ncbi:hypothetical protein HNP84_007044 [Thermocatellispora tengchongensis]|uniref:Uncharacterized protein n=1 Tax=Thermocatellispora tengchongensis TaxID=1073253 RepID=A0A840PDK8_9ACTN|nr:hypothetical protein [Thermocatellispora tengchongensis]MBB5137292.1 hypothetical protein [Thermocatellispora tengchongensis]